MSDGHPISLIYCAKDGKLLEDPDLWAIGMNGSQVEIADQSWIDLPAGGQLITLPGRFPLGFNERSGEIEVIEEVAEQRVQAVAAILPVGLTRSLLPGYESHQQLQLPLFGYTAVGSQKGQLKVAALKTDADLKWNPIYYNTSDLPQLVARKQKQFSNNRILIQLGKCALEYHCLTAQNIFYRRWEAGIPVSPYCNANCLGCISEQPAECCPAPQSRISFIPSQTEVVDLAVTHLESAAEGIISFGQGCEGEPTLQKVLLQDSIRTIRQKTTKGTININSNGGNFDAVQRIVDAGLDSIRISLFSALPESYNWYHRPKDYQLMHVKQAAQYASEHGVAVAINLLLFPGFTNQSDQTEALADFIATTGVKQLQLRNLNLDPDKMDDRLNSNELPSNELPSNELPSICDWLNHLTAKFPELVIGNYTRPKG